MKNLALNLLNATSSQDLQRLYEQVLNERWTSPHLATLMSQAGPDSEHSKLLFAFLPGYQAVLYLERLIDNDPDYLRGFRETENGFVREVCLERARITRAMKHIARIFSPQRRRALTACIAGISLNPRNS